MTQSTANPDKGETSDLFRVHQYKDTMTWLGKWATSTRQFLEKRGDTALGPPGLDPDALDRACAEVWRKVMWLMEPCFVEAWDAWNAKEDDSKRPYFVPETRPRASEQSYVPWSGDIDKNVVTDALVCYGYGSCQKLFDDTREKYSSLAKQEGARLGLYDTGDNGSGSMSI